MYFILTCNQGAWQTALFAALVAEYCALTKRFRRQTIGEQSHLTEGLTRCPLYFRRNRPICPCTPAARSGIFIRLASICCLLRPIASLASIMCLEQASPVRSGHSHRPSVS